MGIDGIDMVRPWFCRHVEVIIIFILQHVCSAVAAEDINDWGGALNTKIIIFMNIIQARDK